MKKKTKKDISILCLTLKRKWFDMIAKGIKKEEYRTIKSYWTKRLFTKVPIEMEAYRPNHFDEIIFKNGYAKDAPTMTVECKGIGIGKAKAKWSDNWKGKVIIIYLGKIKQIHY